MLKKYFIPLVLVLLALVSAIYYFGLYHSRVKDIRVAVPVERFTLSNGLTVVVMPNDRIPVVTHLLVVKAGGGDDPYGKSGLAHYLEHLMFTGTKTYPEGVYDRTVARVGGAQNASTTSDRTLFYATVPRDDLSLVMSMEADRLVNLNFDAPRAARELKVITEERAMRVENNPASQWREQLDAITFLNHPYHQPVIGWAEDMASFTPADAKQFFDNYYRASNMILLVAGDVSVRDVRRLAQKYYGALPAANPPRRDWAKEPPVRMARRGEMHDARVNEPRILRQYIAPSLRDGMTENAIPLAVFAHYLGGGDTSVLYTALVRDQKLASAIEVSYDPSSIGPALLRIGATPANGVSLPELEQAIDRELNRVLNNSLDVAAVARAKTLLTAELTYAQDGMQQLANVMAELYAIGLDENFFYNWAKSIDAVTPEAALAAGRATILSKGAVTGYLLPEEKPAPSQAGVTNGMLPAAQEVQHAN